MARIAVTSCLAAISMLVLMGTGAEADDADFYKIGDRWVYAISLDMDEMNMTGTVTYSVDAITTESVAGVTYDTYTIVGDGAMDITGAVENVALTGTATISETGSIDVERLDTIVSDMNMSMSLTMEVFSESMTVTMWEREITTYSPPGGVGEEPQDPEEGDTWILTYTAHHEFIAYDGDAITTDSDSSTETRTYLYIGRETITVPAGTFDCEVVQVDDGEDIETTWYSDEVGTQVKSVVEYDSSSSGTKVLTAYTFTPKEPGADGATIYVILGVAAAVVVVAAVVALVLLRRKPGAPSAMTPGPITPQDQPPPASRPPEPPPP